MNRFTRFEKATFIFCVAFVLYLFAHGAWFTIRGD